MTVNKLWEIIGVTGERKNLSEFRDKKVAVDLNIWVSKCYNANPKSYLQLIAHRTMALLRQRAIPVFILEGAEPKIMLKKANNSDRNNLECVNMLQYMGCCCIKAQGQAEAMCAYLDATGRVDGCITNDGDCFLYGAKTVYKDYTAGGDSVMKYTMSQITLGREEMIALGVLCGCDYDRGVDGAGKETALMIIRAAENEDILERLRQWRNKEFICPRCGHGGSVEGHSQSGCEKCKTHAQCIAASSGMLPRIAKVKQEIINREQFPRQEVIDEFLQIRDNYTGPIQWTVPDMSRLRSFVESHGIEGTEGILAELERLAVARAGQEQME